MLIARAARWWWWVLVVRYLGIMRKKWMRRRSEIWIGLQRRRVVEKETEERKEEEVEKENCAKDDT